MERSLTMLLLGWISTQVYILVPLGVSVFTLDFAGSGLSDGKFVTLGADEVDDIEV